MAAISGHIPSLRRQLKNVACNYSDAQVKVREATSNDPWGASSSLMSEIADFTYNAMAFTEIMQIVWKRLNDHGKNWRHVYKSLVLLDYLIKVGSEKVANQCRENIFAIQTLKDFQHIEDNKDQGMNVREKAKQLVALLKDDERLKNERTKALMARKRFTQNGSGGSAGRRGIESCRSDSELEECRPTSAGEEELQLQIALALSKEEAEKEQEVTKSDNMRLQLALQESEKPGGKLAAGQALNAALGAPGQSTSSASASALDDLLSLEQPPPYAADPWGSTGHRQSSLDPWGGSLPAADNFSHAGPTALEDPFLSTRPSAHTEGVAKDDLWSSSTGGTSSFAVEQCAKPAISNQTALGDPWGSDVLSPTVIGQRSAPQADLFTDDTPPRAPVELDQGVFNSRRLKTPESFLGENSNLVNLDNLLSGGLRANVGGVQTKSAFAANTNPFAGTSTLNNLNNTTNPFAVQQKRATPTMNEMRNVSTNQQTWGDQAANGQPPSTNPFL